MKQSRRKFIVTAVSGAIASVMGTLIKMAFRH